MKKNVVCLLLMGIAVSLISFSIFSSSKESGLDFWLGSYFHVESWMNPINGVTYTVEYVINISKNDGVVYAEICNQGAQTARHIYATVVGDSNRIDIYLESFLENDEFYNSFVEDGFLFSRFYQHGDLLVSLGIIDGQLVTTWHKMKSNFALVDELYTGSYYERIE